MAILHRVFAVAVECELIAKNPVMFEGRPGDCAENGAQPFRGEQLVKLRQAADEDILAYLRLRWTGLRGSDAVRLAWDDRFWRSGDQPAHAKAKKAGSPAHPLGIVFRPRSRTRPQNAPTG